MRSQVLKFIKDVIRPATPIYSQQRRKLVQEAIAAGGTDLDAPQPPMLAELREKAKAAGLYNFFLPEVLSCKLNQLDMHALACNVLLLMT